MARTMRHSTGDLFHHPVRPIVFHLSIQELGSRLPWASPEELFTLGEVLFVNLFEIISELSDKIASRIRQ